ncbi:MAG TPA: bifunctional histidinol-phosphatase/imidazoleglycerol-phosphate dehydratase HisB [Bacteroidales bacterium]|jgi:imidazoleglycerol-phosphate dehydratase/histidinol-phosphatase|nr:bifunctional histidinol-phosphatase/imidazoleglycerol-phosphate dehydratase HisB [Bacteroidales bacterium]HRS18424.1 bifunctional histidinol-phosphatase/imidazoleglycerol-phosphate dehydratase HisB [Bacteroidales bacterium]
MEQKKRVLFIDRDGSIIVEPKHDFQVDSFEKLEFLPRAISSLQTIAEQSTYILAMVTNQDGLGTDSFPEDTFWPVHNKMLTILANEGVTFSDIVIDRTFPHENKPTRKPGTALLQHYLTDTYDLANSFVIGDRITDIELAKNLGAKAIFINHDNITIPKELQQYCALITQSWTEITTFLLFPPRYAEVIRKTNETDIQIKLLLDGAGKSNISTGLGFFDHMLEQLARHSNCDITIQVKGDLHIDEHHTIEDTALALGEAFLKALGNKQQIERYGFLLPMDESLAQVALDFSGRPWLVWDVTFTREKVGDLPTEMIYHFFKSFSDAARCNLNIQVTGDNEHHKIEAIFKALAKAIKMAVSRNSKNIGLPSTKGVL